VASDDLWERLIYCFGFAEFGRRTAPRAGCRPGCRRPHRSERRGQARPRSRFRPARRRWNSPHLPAVEQRQPRQCREQDQRRGDDDPRGVRSVHIGCSLPSCPVAGVKPGTGAEKEARRRNRAVFCGQAIFNSNGNQQGICRLLRDPAFIYIRSQAARNPNIKLYRIASI